MNPSEHKWGDEDGFEVWKHFAETGGRDKDRMVEVCNWLLAISIAIVGFAFAEGVRTDLVSHKTAFIVLASFGLLVSLVSALVALTYGGYANWNWAKADKIARRSVWPLQPNDEPWTENEKKDGSHLLARWGRCLGQPADTYRCLAPIFLVYFALSLISAAVHTTIVMVAAI